MAGENVFELGGMFNTPTTSPESVGAFPTTYSWNDLNAEAGSSLGLQDSHFTPFYNDYTFTSTPYRYGDFDVANIVGPENTSNLKNYGPKSNLYTDKETGQGYWKNSQGQWMVPTGYRGGGWVEKNLGPLLPIATTMALGAGMFPAFSGAMGGGLSGGVAGGALSGGLISGVKGDSVLNGMVGGGVSGGLQGLSAGTPATVGNNPSAYVPGTPGTSIAGSLGITSPTLGSMVNRGAGSALGTLAQGGSGSDALKSGLTGSLLAGANAAGKNTMDFMKNAFSTLSGADDGLEGLMGSGGDMSGQTDVSPNRYDEYTTGSDGMQTENPAYIFGTGSETPQQQIQSFGGGGGEGFSLPTGLSNFINSAGNFAANNTGDLASMLYGFYNNRKQQKALSGQMNQVNQATSQLQNLFGQNSPYATQLRNQLAAKAAQSGRRSNTAGRETQFQAMLADKAASTLPQIASMQNSMLQTQQARNSLQNNNMNMLLQGMNRMGGWNAVGQGLQSMFKPQASLTGPGSYNAYSNMDNMYGSVG